jgi:AraC-like DNA-binding protein
LRAAVDRALTAGIHARVIEAIRPHVRADTAAFVRYCLTHAGDSPSIQHAARVLGMDRKTLRNRLVQQQLPPPREVLAWCRLLVAARMLEDPGRSVEQVGLALGCGSATALRNLFLRHTGSRPKAIRKLGGMRYVLGLLTATLRDGKRDPAAHVQRTAGLAGDNLDEQKRAETSGPTSPP